ncbi:helix-turn-helix domain-containing protein [Microbispora bryophytorum]|uniref:ArsR/SmtB family transcription factor n=1 Tax=Microbispora bryophytorum TaxID=1460882 RepID=UPI0033E9116D
MAVTHDRTHAAVPGAAGDASEPGTAEIGTAEIAGRGTIAGDAGIGESAEIAGDADIAPVAALIADGARAAMLTALLDGRALAAGELARIAGVSAPTASSHLARLLDGGLVTVVKQGRHRYYRLAGPDVARTLEVLARISGRVAVRSLRQSRQARLLREARSCYDHLAGRVGVELYDALVREAGLIEADGGCLLTASGAQALTELGVDVDRVRRARRRFAPDCLDWLERRPHLGGALGAAVLDRLLAREWLVRGTVPRALRLTGAGREGLERIFGCKDLN